MDRRRDCKPKTGKIREILGQSVAHLREKDCPKNPVDCACNFSGGTLL
jgi:hypothetical protein